jgi:flavorubredoxin
LPTISAFLTYFKGLSPKKRFGLAFGSYGWGGQSIDQIEEVFKSMNLNILDQIKTKYIPREKSLEEIKIKIKALI